MVEHPPEVLHCIGLHRRARDAIARSVRAAPARRPAGRAQRRRDHERSRSEVVSELLWRGWGQVEDEAREARYRSSYQAQPESKTEHSWVEEAVTDLFEERAVRWSDLDHTAEATS